MKLMHLVSFVYISGSNGLQGHWTFCFFCERFNRVVEIDAFDISCIHFPAKLIFWVIEIFLVLQRRFILVFDIDDFDIS